MLGDKIRDILKKYYDMKVGHERWSVNEAKRELEQFINDRNESDTLKAKVNELQKENSKLRQLRYETAEEYAKLSVERYSLKERVSKLEKYKIAVEYMLFNQTNKDRSVAVFKDGVKVLTHKWIPLLDWHKQKIEKEVNHE